MARAIAVRLLSFPLLLTALTLVGCGDVCEEQRMPTCDIREVSCQDTVIAMVQCMRGATVQERPPVTVLTEAEFEAELRGGADPMMMRTLVWEDALHQLGMLSPETSLFEAQVESRLTSTAAFFTPVDNAVYVIDRGEPIDGAEAVALLLHEVVHAVQHQEHDLMERTAVGSHEELLRARLAIEGEATFYQLEALAWSEGWRAEAIDWGAYYDDWLRRTRDALDASPSPFFVVYGAFPYVLGGRHATARWQVGGDRAVRDVMRESPQSAAFMRDPWTSGAMPPERLAESPCEVPPVPAGHELTIRDEMGPLFLYAFLRDGRRMSHAEAWGIAYRWRRDDLFVYAAPGGGVTLAWRIEMNDTSGPRWTAAEAAERGFFAAAADGTVTLLAADPAVVADWSWDALPPGCASP